MKTIYLALLAMLLAAPVFAQDGDRAPDTMADSLLTKKQAETRINEWRMKVKALQDKADALSTEKTQNEQRLAQIRNDVKACNDAIYAMIGATDADVNAFRERVGRLENRIREMKNMSDEQLADNIAQIDALQTEMNEIRRNKIAVLPEFYNKLISMQSDINQLRERAGRGKKFYTVGTWSKDRDCLWNIAEKNEIYADAFMWPKIWQANTDQIRNPDLIYPGQKLTIPPRGPKSDEEMRAERLYYRKKKIAAAAAARARRAAAERTQQVDQQEAGSGEKK